MYQNYLEELNTVTHDLLETLTAFTDEEFNRFPGPEKWSAGQMTDHVLQSLNGSHHMISGPDKAAERPVDQNIPQLKAVFLDYSKSLKSPDFILPRKTMYDKHALLEELRRTVAGVNTAAAQADLNMMTADKLPVLGQLSKLEAVYFTIVHTQRHVRQARRIYEQVTANAIA